MMKRNITLLVLLALFGVFAGNAQSAAPSAPQIYIAGSYTDGISERACYWVNGVRKNLPDGTAAESITVVDGKVYAAGKDSSNKACYWIDGVKTQLDRSGAVSAKGIALTGGKVYVAASYTDNAGYWLDGVFRQLFRYNKNGGIAGIAVDDGILYFCGYEDNRGFYTIYGETKGISNYSAPPQGIAVVNGMVYITGSYNIRSHDEWVQRPYFWAEGVLKALPIPLQGGTGDREIKGEGTGITVVDGRVYVAGWYTDASKTKHACYWVDGQRRELSGGFEAAAIAVSDGNIYAAGAYQQGSTIKACYWVNGERKEFPGGLTAASITIVK